MMNKVGILLIKSKINSEPSIRRTLDTLKLKTLNSFCILERDLCTEGKLKALRSYVSWGPITEEQEKFINSKIKEDRKIIKFCPAYKGINKKEILGYNKNFYDFILEKYILRSSYKKK